MEERSKMGGEADDGDFPKSQTFRIGKGVVESSCIHELRREDQEIKRGSAYFRQSEG